MRAPCKVSVIVPVFNSPELTHACLESLASTLPAEDCEIIVVNGTPDNNEDAFPQSGATIFERNFVSCRCDDKSSFGQAATLGAGLARGEHIVFWDTAILARPGWLDPLLHDFAVHPKLFATGPILVYPHEGPFGKMVRHLGFAVTPDQCVESLYEYVPVDAPFINKRRFFQCIAARCMMVPRELFLRNGGFDGRHGNGVEDIELCARFGRMGYTMTIHPGVHLARHGDPAFSTQAHEDAWAASIAQSSFPSLAPDLHSLLREDGFTLGVSDWGTLAVCRADEDAGRPGVPQTPDPAELSAAILRHPFRREGYTALAKLYETQGDLQAACRVRACPARLRMTPEELLPLYRAARACGESRIADDAFGKALEFCRSFSSFQTAVTALHSQTRSPELQELSARFQAWEDNAERVYTETYRPFLREIRELTKDASVSMFTPWAYTLWRELRDIPERKNNAGRLPHRSDAPAFSVLMPVYNPRPEHLLAAVHSLLAQTWPHWELCIADDASPNPQIHPLLESLAARDTRVRVVYRKENGHIAAATNTALEMARHAFVALMDQDDLLTEDALEIMAATISATPRGMLFYSDEDKVRDDGMIFFPHLKKDEWDADLITGQNFVSHLGVYRTDRLREIGGFREGFPGAQDYDMLLRYGEGLPEESFIHIPKVLYHWRSHEGSTAGNTNAKPEALHSGANAVAEHLDRTGRKGRVVLMPGRIFLRVRYDLPQPRPFVSLVVDLGNDPAPAKNLAETMAAVHAAYPESELVVGYDSGITDNIAVKFLLRRIEKQPFITVHPLEATAPSERLNQLAGQCAGQVLGVMGKGVSPLHDDWLEELVSRLYQPGVGVVGSRMLHPSGRILHAGYNVDATGHLAAMFNKLPHDVAGYFGWSYLARTVAAVDGLCLFTKVGDFADAGRFHAGPGWAWAFDYCLRLKEKGLRTVVSPFADCVTAEENFPWLRGVYVADPAFSAQWEKKTPPVHPDLQARVTGWELYWDAEPPVGGEPSCPVPPKRP